MKLWHLIAIGAGVLLLTKRASASAGSCTSGGITGRCQPTSTPCSGHYQAGLCPGAANIQCCLPPAKNAACDCGTGCYVRQGSSGLTAAQTQACLKACDQKYGLCLPAPGER